MNAGLVVQLNGQSRSFPELEPGVTLAAVVEALGLKADRIAVELNGEIAPRTGWAERQVTEGDRLEIVHFVGGGAGSAGAKNDGKSALAEIAEVAPRTRSRK